MSRQNGQMLQVRLVPQAVNRHADGVWMNPLPGSIRKPGIFALALALAVVATGCRLVKTTTAVPARTVSVFFPGGKSNQPDLGDLQQRTMQFADSYLAVTIESVDELKDVAGFPFDEAGLLRFKIATCGGVLTIATGDNPYANLLDMVSFASITRLELLQRMTMSTNGMQLEKWLERSSTLESNIWSIADQVFSQQQQAELKQTIQTHFASISNRTERAFLLPQDLLIPRSIRKAKDQESIFNLAALDPLSSLDPAVREITETRLFAARALFMVQRMPWLVRWQAELLVIQTTQQPQIAQALNDTTRLSESVDRASRAAESISQTAEQLPDQIAAERKAILSALEAQEGKLNTMLLSGTKFSDSLSITITNFDALMKRFGVGEPDTNPAPAESESPPFNILDYAKTAEQITAMAKELNATINDLNNALDSPALDRLSNQATADVRGILNHVFLLAAGLVILVLVCALAYRAVGRRPRDTAAPRPSQE